MSIDRILAWRPKGGAALHHHNTDGSIDVGGDTSKAPFEGHPDADESVNAAAAAAAVSIDAVAAPSPSPSPAPTATTDDAAIGATLSASWTAVVEAKAAKKRGTAAAAASSSSSKKKSARSSKPSTVAAAAAAAATATATSTSRKKKTPAADAPSSSPPSRKKKSPAADSSAPAVGSKRKKSSANADSSDAAAAAADDADTTDTPAAASALVIPPPMLGRRRKNFTPVTSSEAMAAFQRSLLAARQAAGLGDAPMTGAYAPKRISKHQLMKQQLAAEEREMQSDDASSSSDADGAEESDADRDESDDAESSDADSNDEDASDDEDEDAAPSSKRRRILSAKKKKSSSSSKTTKKPKSTASKANRPTHAEIRESILAEHSGKEFFVTFKGRSYLHAKWVDVFAFLPPQSSSSSEDAPGASEQPTAAWTQLRVKLQRFLRATPTPIGDDEEVFMPDWVEIDRILARKTQPPTDADGAPAASSGPHDTHYLIKWQGLSYGASTWEHSRYVRDDTKIAEFERRQRLPTASSRPASLGASYSLPRPPPSDWDRNRVKMVAPDHVPTYKNGNQLREHQIEGVNWLNFNCQCTSLLMHARARARWSLCSHWLTMAHALADVSSPSAGYQRKGCIIADEMGLGKTVQVVTHLLHLRTVHARGPFLIIVPLSTLPHWKREFDTWSDLNVVVFQGNKEDRDMVKQYEWSFFTREAGEYDGRTTMVQEEYKFDVLLCTYESILSETGFLAKVPWRSLVVDEVRRHRHTTRTHVQALALVATSRHDPVDLIRHSLFPLVLTVSLGPPSEEPAESPLQGAQDVSARPPTADDRHAHPEQPRRALDPTRQTTHQSQQTHTHAPTTQHRPCIMDPDPFLLSIAAFPFVRTSSSRLTSPLSTPSTAITAFWRRTIR